MDKLPKRRITKRKSVNVEREQIKRDNVNST